MPLGKFEDLVSLNKQENIEISIKEQKQIENELISQIIPHNNHKIWEINNETFEIEAAKYSTATAVIFGETPKKEIIMKQNYTYVSALNKKNALKKFKNGFNGSKNVWDSPMTL